MSKRPGLGAGMEARFRPSVHWGAEFLPQRVRLCAFGEKEGRPEPVITFEGGYAEAEDFARSHGLAYEGLHAAVSHLPFKLEPLEPAPEGAEDDISVHAERLRPQGLSADSLEAQGFRHGEDRYMILAREDALQPFTENLPQSLGGLWSLSVPPLVLLSFLDAALPREDFAALICEGTYSHLLFFREGSLAAYAKLFTGWEDADRDPAAFGKEMKKALVYHFGSRFPGAALESLQIWLDGPAGQAASALEGLGIPRIDPDWGPLESLPGPLRTAGALALGALRGLEPTMSFTLPRPAAAESRRLWRGRAGALARTGYQVFAGVSIGAALLVLSALGMRLMVESKARTWSGELQRWDEFQKRKADVERQLGGMQGLLARRTDGYAGMQRIAGLLPSEVWLESWEMESAPGRGFQYRLEGYGLIEARIPEFLANLEKSREFTAVKLKSTERIPAESAERKTGIQANRKELVRFQIGVWE